MEILSVMNEIAVFLETTLEVEEARKILPKADYYPSAKKGDVIDAIRRKYKIIIIIDGAFSWSASIWHKEIIMALNKDILVYGCSSMGALRASELDDFGMIGYGKVYNMYKNKHIDGDDEVAISYNSKTEEKTIPMVNLRITVEYLNLAEKNKILKSCQDVFYANRTWSHLKKVVDISVFEKIYSNYLDVKKNDAISLLNKIENHNILLPDKRKIYGAGYTYFSKLMLEERYGLMFIEFASSVSVDISFSSSLINRASKIAQLVDVPVSSENINLLCRLVYLADNCGFKISEDYIEDNIYKFREEKKLISGESFYNWLEEKGLSTCDLMALFCDFFLIKKVYESNFEFDNYLK